MKNSTLLNSHLSYQIAQLGHTDQLVVADAGLPIPLSVNKIDLALTSNIPSFIDTISVVMSEMFIEKVILAEEIKYKNVAVHQVLLELLDEYQARIGEKVDVLYCSHEKFKAQVKETKCVVRTGECSPFANIILQSGVNF